jgi:hypothetical protein
MKKINVLWVILDLIFLVIFNALFFSLGGMHHKTSVWISYAFIHFAYFILLLTAKLIRGAKSSAVFGFSLYSVSGTYFLVEFLVGAVIIFNAPDSYVVSLLVQLVLAGSFGIILISNMIANEHTADSEEKRKLQIDYVKQASAELKSIMDRITDKDARRKVEKVYDALYSSPAKSHPNVAQAESRILASIGLLKSAVLSGEKNEIVLMVDQLLIAIDERNRQLKMFN